MYTVKQLSDLAGVSIRTLHYYDEIGLLEPTSHGENGYRFYDEKKLIHLQQILFYRELDLQLSEIRKIMQRADFDVLAALQDHKRSLDRKKTRIEKLIQTVDMTIMHLKGQTTMSKKKLFEAFSEEEQERYASEAEKMYDPETVRASNRKWKAYSAEKKQSILDEGSRIYTGLIEAMPQGPGSPQVQDLIDQWRKHMDYFWTPNLDQLLGLADLYNNNPDFKANFDKMHPELAAFMKEAVTIYVANQR